MNYQTFVLGLQAAVNVGALGFLGLAVNWYWHRRRWRRFQKAISDWAREEEFETDQMTEKEWRSLVAMKLGDAQYSPSEILKLLDLAVIVAQGLASMAVRGRI